MNTEIEILCSTGALIRRPNHRNHKLLKGLSEQLECDGFEFMMEGSWMDIIEDVMAEVKAMNLYIPVMHSEKYIGEAISQGGEEELREALRRFEINCRMANKIGGEKIVVHLWGGISSDQNFDRNLKAYP
ncbi:MAG: Xylose isomerase protein barrel, partial [Clostridiales bacterium]|nr:Xylose isomerase protein barrel [Clostridiales bacterium]